VAAGNLICAIAQPGVAVVYKAGDALEILARNALDEPVLASPAIANGTIYIRTRQRLLAFRDHRPAAPGTPNAATP
jgi:hypothetical protein